KYGSIATRGHIKQLTRAYFPRLPSVGSRDRRSERLPETHKVIRKTNDASLKNSIRQLAFGRATAPGQDHSHKPNSVLTLDTHHRSNYGRNLSCRRRQVAGAAALAKLRFRRQPS